MGYAYIILDVSDEAFHTAIYSVEVSYPLKLKANAMKYCLNAAFRTRSQTKRNSQENWFKEVDKLMTEQLTYARVNDLRSR